MYHWETVKIIGNFEQIQGTWWVCVDCTRWGVPEPSMLEGRCITIKGQRKRLGAMAPKARKERAYYRPWEIQDYTPPPPLAEALRALWLVAEPAKRDKEIARLRVWLKDVAARERACRPFDATAPSSIDGWQRWALEPLDWTLLNQSASTDWPLPANQLSISQGIDFYEVFNMFKANRGSYYEH